MPAVFCTESTDTAPQDSDSVADLPPNPTLLPPIRLLSNPTQLSLGDRCSTEFDPWHFEYLFLNVRCEQERIHDLGQPSTGQFAESGKLRLVGNLAGGKCFATSGVS